MPTLDLSGNILSAGAGYQAGDWGQVGAEASLDFQASANLNRGIDIGIGASALVRLDGSIRKFLAADVTGQAHAAAGVRAQVQVPLDLFDEAGVAIRLQAVAEAAAGITLAIGLSLGDFLDLAGQDPRMAGAPLKLLRVFLEETTIQGGVMAKAAVSAMAYANIAMTGRLLPRGVEKPGFTVAAEAGVGLKAGAGFRAFARFGLDDPRRLLRRSVDIAVDETLRAIGDLLPVESARLAEEMRAPAKIALRSAIELGMTLAENSGSFRSTDGGKVALRCVQVALEEAQRYIMERTVDLALHQLRIGLQSLGFDDARWNAAAPQRQALADRLRALPEDPFEPTDANKQYWLDLIRESAQVAIALSAAGQIPPPLAGPLSVLWSGTQLLFIAVKRVSEASARASVLGMSPVQTHASFGGNLTAPPSDAIKEEINRRLGRPLDTVLRQEDAVAFLTRSILDSPLIEAGSPVRAVVDLLAGPQAEAPSAALNVLFSNLGAFVPGADGQVSAPATLAVLRDALRSYLDTRVTLELRPLVAQAAGGSPEVLTYFDEVLLSTLRTVVGPVFDAVLSWQQGSTDTQRALRELCSSLVMRLLGRSLIVTGDVLLAKALEAVQSGLRDAAGHVDDNGGVAPVLAQLTGLDRDFVAEVVEETLLVCADTFGPMPPEKRARVRELLYEAIDTAPSPDATDPVGALQAAGLIPDGEAATELAFLLGEEIAGNVVRFIGALLTRIGALILEELQEIIADIQQAVEEWIAGLQQLAQDLARQIHALLEEIEQLGRELEDAADRVLDQAADLLGAISDRTSSRNAARSALKDYVAGEVLDVLALVPFYQGLPRDVRREARRRVKGVVNALLDGEIFDPVLDAVSNLADGTAEFLEDLRDIEPGDDVVQEILELFLDRLEDAVRDIFGHDDPRIDIRFTVPFTDIEIDLGHVDIPLGGLVRALRAAARDLRIVQDAAADLASSFVDLIERETGLRAAEAEQTALAEQKTRTDGHLAETNRSDFDLTIVSPAPASALEGEVPCEILVRGATPAFLGLEEGDQPRLFLWVNQEEVPLDRVTVEAFDARGSLGDVLAGIPRLNGGLHRLIQDRAARRQRLRHDASPVRTKQDGAGTRTASTAGLLARPGSATRQAGKGVAFKTNGGPAPGRKLRPNDVAGALNHFSGHRIPGGRAAVETNTEGPGGLRIRLTLPADLLLEGVNSVACALVPGSAARRLEKAVTFLFLPKAAVEPGTLTMPGRLAWDAGKLRPGLASDLRARFGPQAIGPVESPEGPAPKPSKGGMWLPVRSERKQAVERSSAAIRKNVSSNLDRQRQLREALEKRALRPVPQQVRKPGTTRSQEGGRHATA